MDNSKLVKTVYNELKSLHDLGFRTWYSHVCELAEEKNIDIFVNDNNFKYHCKNNAASEYIQNWHAEIHNITKNPITRFYNKIKTGFTPEYYLNGVENKKYRVAITKLLASSHPLEIQRGTYNKTPVHDRLCKTCNAVDDELQFIFKCKLHYEGRDELIVK